MAGKKVCLWPTQSEDGVVAVRCRQRVMFNHLVLMDGQVTAMDARRGVGTCAWDAARTTQDDRDDGCPEGFLIRVFSGRPDEIYREGWARSSQAVLVEVGRLYEDMMFG